MSLLVYAVDKDLYGFSGPCTKFTYSCSARQNTCEFFQSIFGLRDTRLSPGSGFMVLYAFSESEVFD